MATVFFAVLGVACIRVFGSARHALILLLLIGFTQDMVRKSTPGEPVIFIVTVGVLFASVLIGIWARQGFLNSLQPFLAWSDRLREPMLVFLFILLAQLIYSILRYNNFIIGLIGLTTYLAPFLALIVGYALANTVDGIRSFLKLYVALGVLVALTVVASFVGIESVLLKEVGQGLKIYDQGTVLQSHSGIMRTGEVAAWHITTAACLMVTLAVTSKKQRNLVLTLVVVGLLLVVVALTGRRKMLMLGALFLVGFVLALSYYRKSLDARLFYSLLTLICGAWLAYELIAYDSYSESLRNYIARGSTVFADASGRFMELGISPVQWAYNRVGILGGGLGIASQGSYLFNLANVAGGSAEGGLGKIMVELGLPGLVCVVWLLYAFTQHVDICLKLGLRPGVDQRLLPLMLGLAVLIGGNAVTFSVATQVYGDTFILILLGLMGGFVFALPKIAFISTLKHEHKGQEIDMRVTDL